MGYMANMGGWSVINVGFVLQSVRLQSLLQGIYEKDENPGKIIIFIETKRRVESISRYIRGFGVKCGTLHGDKSQNERDFVLREFRTGKSNILVATDVAARGLGKYTQLVSLPSLPPHLSPPSAPHTILQWFA